MCGNISCGEGEGVYTGFTQSVGGFTSFSERLLGGIDGVSMQYRSILLSVIIGQFLINCPRQSVSMLAIHTPVLNHDSGIEAAGFSV